MDRPFWALLLLLSCTYNAALSDEPRTESTGWGSMAPAPSENECRSFIEAALKEQRSQAVDSDKTLEESTTSEAYTAETLEQVVETKDETSGEQGDEDGERRGLNDSMTMSEEDITGTLSTEQDEAGADSVEGESQETASAEVVDEAEKSDEKDESIEGGEETGAEQEDSVEDAASVEANVESETGESAESEIVAEGEVAEDVASAEQIAEAEESAEDTGAGSAEQEGTSATEEEQKDASVEQENASVESAEAENVAESEIESAEDQEAGEATKESNEDLEKPETEQSEVKEDAVTSDIADESVSEEEKQVNDQSEQSPQSTTEAGEDSGETAVNQSEEAPTASAEGASEEQTSTAEHQSENAPADNMETSNPEETNLEQNETLPSNETEEVSQEEEEESPEQEDLTLKIEIPENLRPRSHLFEVLRLDSGSVDVEKKLLKTEETTLKDLKRLYEAAIKPLEILYKYRDLSNRHFGDPEIFSKPLILFMGPWSGGKSTIINYLLDNEYKDTALRTGAEPSPAYFNIVMWGEREEILDGTQLAADWTFSGLQKFGQGLLDRLRGLKMNHPLLEKVNIIEIPGILEIRKQVERLFPLNDACQWFIDRADIIFLVYDPSKLDVGPETEAILDQLKGREYQTKIILNKADQVKPEELMRVQGTLIWNISPLMSSTEPPVMYSTSLWSHPYQSGSPSRLLFAQEKAFLKDLREAVDKRVENKISSARRFAVRVRNHAKMVDCYLTTYYNHKSFFGNKQKVSNDIIEHPQNYHIYEGLSTLTNISRYDLPDPDVYRDFFRLNPVYDFQQLSSTCTYFKGCPINRLDVAIAYELPELVGKYKKLAEDIIKSQSKEPGKK